MNRGLLGAALAAVTVVAVGCKDTTGIAPPTAGSLAFSYTGAQSGSYSASGLLTRHNDTSFVKQSFAAGLTLSNGGKAYVGLLSYAPVATATGDEVVLIFPSVGAGQTLTFTETCTATTPNCSLGLIAFDANPDLVNDGSDTFFFTAGTIQVTSVSNGRITGTFSGTAADSLGTRTITVTGGTFDVPLRSQSTYPSGNRAVPTTPFQRLLIRKN
ncbi:MAG: hypothetical protein ACJ8GN_16925 [Longimicrobiaceae bacterium]